MTYRFYEQDYLEIPLQDFPDAGDLMVCHDPQNRLGKRSGTITWAVLKCSGGEHGVSAQGLGLFWDVEEALSFAENRPEE